MKLNKVDLLDVSMVGFHTFFLSTIFNVFETIIFGIFMLLVIFIPAKKEMGWL